MIDIYNIRCPTCIEATIVHIEPCKEIGITCYCQKCNVRWVEDEKGIVEIGWYNQELGTLAVGAKIII